MLFYVVKLNVQHIIFTVYPFICLYGSCDSIDMCSNRTVTGDNLILYRANNQAALYHDCYCSVRSTTGLQTKVTFNTISLITRCQYRLAISYSSSTSYFGCKNNVAEIFFTINGSEEINLQLEPGTADSGGLEFNLNITSRSGTDATLECYVVRNGVPLPSTLIPSSTSTSTAVVDVTTSTSTMSSITSRDPEDAIEENLCETNQSTIIGAAVGSFISGLIIGGGIVLVVLWYRWKKKKPDEVYTATGNGVEDGHTYSNLRPKHNSTSKIV